MALTTGTIQQLRYFPALVPDGTFLAALPPNAPVPIMDLPNLAQLSRITRLRRLRTTAYGGVSLTVTADQYSTPPVDTGAIMAAPVPAGLADDPWAVTAASKLTATVTNGTGAPVPDWWATWLVEVDTPNAALLQQYASIYPSLPANLAAAAQAEQLTDPPIRSLAPRPLRWIIENEYRSQLRRAVMLGQTITLPASLTPTLFVQDVRSDPGEMLVLAGLVTSAGSGTDQLTIVISVDEQSALYTVAAYPLGQVGFVPMFLQAQKTLQVQAYTLTAEPVAVAGAIWHVGLTDAIAYRLGQPAPPAITQPIDAGTL